MAGEVISLLSSPSLEPAASLDLPAKHPARSRSPPPKEPPSLLDLTSSSPISAPKRDRPRSSQHLPPPKRHSSGGAQLDLHFLSDDFDTTGDLGQSSQLRRDTENNKRLRLSPPEASKRVFRRSQSAADGAGRSPARQAAGLRRTQTLIDPIECSSSPGLGARPRASGDTVYDDPFATSSPVRKLGAVERAVVDVDDPFASSPQRPAATAARTKPMIDIDDPFASSPPQGGATAVVASSLTGATASAATLAPKTSATIVDLLEEFGDPFASSPQQAPAPLQATASTAAALNSKPRSPRGKVDWDPISSSAPQLLRDSFDSPSPPARPRDKGKQPAVIDLSDSELSALESHKWSDSDGSDLPDVKDMNFSKARAPRSKSASLPRTTSATSKTSRPRAQPAAKKPTENKAREKEAKAAERERERERKKREKDAAKEQKARDKEKAAAMAEVNKVRTDKKVSAPEMIVDLPASLPRPLALQAQTLLRDLDVEFSEWQSPVDRVVKWRRKVRSRFNEDLGLWEPMPLRIEDEAYAMVVVTADEFVALALGTEGADLEAHVAKMKQLISGGQLLYLIEGLGPWIRKNRNVRNRQFVSAVRSQENDAAPTSSQPSRRRKAQTPKEYIDEDTVEDALLQLQVLHGALIHHTAAAVETAQWIAIFTQHISTVPYRKQREAANAAGAGFCMESGQVRTGDDTRDTYARMLQEIVRVTAPIAYGIAEEFGSVTGLVRGLEERGPLALEACRKSANKDGAVSDRTIGQAVSRRIYKVFTGKDETSMDV